MTDTDQSVRDSLLKAFFCLFTAWAVLSGVVLIAQGVLYLRNGVEIDRTTYVREGVSPRLAEVVQEQLNGALGAQDAVHYAIRKRDYTNPMDYRTVDRLLAPMFEAFP